MKLAVKLVATIVLGIAVVLMVDGYISLNRQHDLFEGDMRHDLRVLGLTMRKLVIDAWNAGGRARAEEVIEDANRVDPSVDIRWVWLDSPPGEPATPRVSRDRLKAVVHGQDDSIVARDAGGRAYFYSYFPVAVAEQRAGALELREPLSVLDEFTRGAFLRIVILTGLLVLLSGGATVLLGIRLIGRPLDQIVGKIRRIGTGDFSGPLRLSGHDELGELAVGLNTMCSQLDEAQARVMRETKARITALEQLRHEDRLKTLGRLASSIAHELGTPLNVISGYAGMVAGGSMSADETIESAQIIKSQSERIAGIVRRILDFARPRTEQRFAVDLRQLIHQTLAMMGPLARKQNVELVLAESDGVVIVKADGEQIRQVLLNLITNAVQAMPHGGNVQITMGPTAARPPETPNDSDRSYVCVSVLDEGEGIAEEHLSRIFEPFFTTKEPGKGTGLGLSIAEGIVREHGGWIAVESTLGRGSRFSVYLPVEKGGEICPNES